MAKFFRRGKSRIYFAATVAGYSSSGGVGSGAPTSTEISTGTELTASIAAMTGFELTNAPINTPDLGATFTKTIPGEDTTAASSLTFYDDDTATTIRTALAKGTAGFVLLLPYGTGAGKRVETWPVRTTGVNDIWDLGNDAGRFVVGFAITDIPSQNGVQA